MAALRLPCLASERRDRVRPKFLDNHDVRQVPGQKFRSPIEHKPVMWASMVFPAMNSAVRSNLLERHNVPALRTDRDDLAVKTAADQFGDFRVFVTGAGGGPPATPEHVGQVTAESADRTAASEFRAGFLRFALQKPV